MEIASGMSFFSSIFKNTEKIKENKASGKLKLGVYYLKTLCL